jgi:integrase
LAYVNDRRLDDHKPAGRPRIHVRLYWRPRSRVFKRDLRAFPEALGPMYVALVPLGFDGGLRRGEILGLQWSDLDLQRMLMVVRHNIVRGVLDIPKGRTEHEVGITRRLGEALQALPRTGPFVFDNAGSHYKDHNIQSRLRTLLERAGMPWRGTHILRKTCGTRIADNGGGVSAVASHLRHKKPADREPLHRPPRCTSRALKALES